MIRALPALAFACLFISGCATYVTPGAPADFRALGVSQADAESRTTSGVREAFERKPAAGFPAAVAIARVQGAGYRSYSSQGYGDGAFTFVSVRDVEEDTDIDRLSKLPMIAGLAPLNRIVIPGQIRKEEDLRNAAAQVQADVLLLYTFDTQFDTDTTIPYAGTLSLGLFPNKRAKVTTTASAAFIDVRTGFIYGLAEVTDTEGQMANAWTRNQAVEDARQRVEKSAFKKLVSELEKTWTGIAQRYGPPASTTTQTMHAP